MNFAELLGAGIMRFQQSRQREDEAIASDFRSDRRRIGEGGTGRRLGSTGQLRNGT